VVAVALFLAWPSGEAIVASRAGAEGAASAERTPRIDPLAAIFGSSLGARPEVERVVRDLLREGMASVPVETVDAMRAALRAEASAIVERPDADRDEGAVLLAAALLELTGDDIAWSTPFAVLAAERDAGTAPRVLLAQAIVDIERARSGGEEALAAARERLVEIRTQCGATGLDVVAENVARFTPPSAVPPDAIRRPARS
jgi:hypothetical protein